MKSSPRRFRCALGTLSAFSNLLCFSLDGWATRMTIVGCVTVDLLLAFKTFHKQKHRFYSKCHPVKIRNQISFSGLARRLHPPSPDRRRGILILALQFSTPLAEPDPPPPERRGLSRRLLSPSPDRRSKNVGRKILRNWLNLIPDLVQGISWEKGQHKIRHHQRHHQRQPGEPPFPLQVVTG